MRFSLTATRNSPTLNSSRTSPLACPVDYRTDERRIGEHSLAPLLSASPRVGDLDGKARLAKLHKILSGQTLEGGTHVIDDVQIAVRAVGVAQTDVGADCLVIGGIRLHESRQVHETVEGIAGLQS